MTNKTLEPKEKYNLILDLKRSNLIGNKFLRLYGLKKIVVQEGAENTIVITGDYLCFLFAAINNVDCVFLGAKNSLFYSDKIREFLNCGEPQPSLTLKEQQPSLTLRENKRQREESSDEESNKKHKGSPNQSGGLPTIHNSNTEEEQIYFYTEEDYMDDFYTLLKNIRHNTMSWHYETIDGGVSDEEDYYNNIYIKYKF